MSPIAAGAARAIITPRVGVDLCGFGGRAGPSQGVHDDLRACALALSDGETGILIVTLDLIGLLHDDVVNLRHRVRERTGIPPEGVMFCCSHTHSGPVTACLEGLGKQDKGYLKRLGNQLVDLAEEAWTTRRQSKVAALRTPPVSVGINRREVRNGRMVIGINENGTTAPYVDVLAVDGLDDTPIARLFCHAAHAVTLGGDNLQISGDWPGYAQRILEDQLGDTCVALFMQGCCGNINSHPRGSFEHAEAQGRTIARAVCDANAEADWSTDIPVSAASAPLELTLLPPPSPEDAQAELTRLEDTQTAERGSANYGNQIMNEHMVEWARQIAELAERPLQERTIPFEVQGIRAGEFAVVGLPGEVFVEYALNIDADSPFGVTTVAAYTNGNVGYIPTAAAYPEGGYEVTSAIRFYGTTMPVPGSEERILQTAKEVLQKLA